MLVDLNSSGTLLAVLFVVLHILLVGILFYYLCKQAPRKPVGHDTFAKDATQIKRRVDKTD